MPGGQTWRKHHAAGYSGSTVSFLECPDCHALVPEHTHGWKNEDQAWYKHNQWHIRNLHK